MKKIIKLGILIIATFCFNLTAYASSFSANVSSTSVYVGGRVTVTLNCQEMVGYLTMTSSNGSILSGGFSRRWFENERPSYTFVANSVGTATIDIQGVLSDSAGIDKTISQKITITVKAKPVIVLSGDSSLSNMYIDDATISPEFNKDTLEYTTELQPDTTKINIVAEANHRGASISGIGVREVSDGDNRLEIVVTAENGTTSTYVINAKVKEFNPIEVQVDGLTYTVVRKRSTIVPPENYTETTVTINNEEVPAYYSDITKYTLVSLKDTNGNQNFYIYQDGTYKLYKELNFNQMKICLLDMPNVPENYQNGVFVYNDENINAYKTSPSSSYALLYGMNVATGEKNYYLYESTENTIQIYNTEEIDELNKKIDIYTYIIIGLLGFSFVLLISLIISVCRKDKTSKEQRKLLKKQEKQRKIDEKNRMILDAKENKIREKEEKKKRKQEKKYDKEKTREAKKEEEKRLKEEKKLKKDEHRNKKNSEIKVKKIEL